MTLNNFIVFCNLPWLCLRAAVQPAANVLLMPRGRQLRATEYKAGAAPAYFEDKHSSVGGSGLAVSVCFTVC